MRDNATRRGSGLAACVAVVCSLLGGCGGTGAKKSDPSRSPPPGAFHYSVLERPGSSGISVIAPSQVAAAKRTATHPIWVALESSSRRTSARPEIDSARELIHLGSLRVWLADNAGGGICILGFNPRNAPDPEHDHSLLVFCGSESARGEGELMEERLTRHSYLIVGAVPDGVRLVSLRLANGEHREVAVSANCYHATIPTQVAEVSFSGET